jgi:molybdopterin synthase catalytic subunit
MYRTMDVVIEGLKVVARVMTFGGFQYYEICRANDEARRVRLLEYEKQRAEQRAELRQIMESQRQSMK